MKKKINQFLCSKYSEFILFNTKTSQNRPLLSSLTSQSLLSQGFVYQLKAGWCCRWHQQRSDNRHCERPRRQSGICRWSFQTFYLQTPDSWMKQKTMPDQFDYSKKTTWKTDTLFIFTQVTLKICQCVVYKTILRTSTDTGNINFNERKITDFHWEPSLCFMSVWYIEVPLQEIYFLTGKSFKQHKSAVAPGFVSKLAWLSAANQQ